MIFAGTGAPRTFVSSNRIAPDRVYPGFSSFCSQTVSIRIMKNLTSVLSSNRTVLQLVMFALF
ncbi:MAG: hypothetical protein L6Q97_13135, partial [Thermoanaerobaculia bacterium]|nr:hypothetical protein [Thermoanaerobaculia bacterium]